jgi:hypothetical protein
LAPSTRQIPAISQAVFDLSGVPKASLQYLALSKTKERQQPEDPLRSLQ